MRGVRWTSAGSRELVFRGEGDVRVDAFGWYGGLFRFFRFIVEILIE